MHDTITTIYIITIFILIVILYSIIMVKLIYIYIYTYIYIYIIRHSNNDCNHVDTIAMQCCDTVGVPDVTFAKGRAA